MGRSDPAGSRPGWGGGARGKVLLGIAAALAIAFGAYQLGRRASAPLPLAPASSLAATAPRTAPPQEAVVRATPVPQSTDELIAAFERAHPSPREERSEMEVTMARPEPAPATQPPLDLPETPRDKMARCLSFRVETDEIHYGGYSPAISPVKVTASNACSFSFEGPDVSVEVRAIPLHGEGTLAHGIAQFQEPIPSRGQSETRMVLGCPRCDDVTHRFEVQLAAPR